MCARTFKEPRAPTEPSLYLIAHSKQRYFSFRVYRLWRALLRAATVELVGTEPTYALSHYSLLCVAVSVLDVVGAVSVSVADSAFEPLAFALIAGTMISSEEVLLSAR
eukprot:6094-Heterococcus_DN1.PRE.1